MLTDWTPSTRLMSALLIVRRSCNCLSLRSSSLLFTMTSKPTYSRAEIKQREELLTKCFEACDFVRTNGAQAMAWMGELSH